MPSRPPAMTSGANSELRERAPNREANRRAGSSVRRADQPRETPPARRRRPAAQGEATSSRVDSSRGRAQHAPAHVPAHVPAHRVCACPARRAPAHVPPIVYLRTSRPARVCVRLAYHAPAHVPRLAHLRTSRLARACIVPSDETFRAEKYTFQSVNLG